jgi:hypothetical protein
MSSRRVVCPSCGGMLSLPGDVRGCAVRCGLCRKVFRLPEHIPVPEDTILGWLGTEEEESPDEKADTLAPLSEEEQAAQQRRSGRRLRLVSLGRRGALFEFPAGYLRETAFRCSMPRVCAHCLGRVRLSAHLIIFAPQLRDSISLEAEHRAGQLSIPQTQLRDLHGEALLARLPRVPNVPSPADLPMPYWLCELCSGAGEISGQIQVDPDTGRGFCRLAVRNLQLAAAFFAAAGGEGTHDHVRLREFLRRLQEDRWEALPSAVRHRIEQWFRPGRQERFLAYVPDRHFSRSEDGMAGVVVSDRRLVYHRPPMHRELPGRSNLSVQVRHANGRDVVTIDAYGGKGRPLAVDPRGMMLLRRVLSEGGFKAVWR